MVELRVCSFCGVEIEPGTGKMYIKKDGTVFLFCTNKCSKNMIDMSRIPRRTTWTRAYSRDKEVRVKARETAAAPALVKAEKKEEKPTEPVVEKAETKAEEPKPEAPKKEEKAPKAKKVKPPKQKAEAVPAPEEKKE